MPSQKDYITIGQRFDTADMLEQIDYALLLARRDGKILRTCGWIEEDTKKLSRLREELAEKFQAFKEKHGSRPARQKAVADLVAQAKRWRMQALAIGRNALSGESLTDLELLARPTYSNPGLLAETIQSLLLAAEKNPDLFASRGTPNTFLEEGREVLDRLKDVLRGRELAADNDNHDDLADGSGEIEELCGRAWEAMKKLNRSGRAAQLLAGRRRMASDYNLDILSGQGEKTD